jgi:hypothetical protein
MPSLQCKQLHGAQPAVGAVSVVAFTCDIYHPFTKQWGDWRNAYAQAVLSLIGNPWLQSQSQANPTAKIEGYLERWYKIFLEPRPKSKV